MHDHHDHHSTRVRTGPQHTKCSAAGDGLQHGCARKQACVLRHHRVSTCQGLRSLLHTWTKSSKKGFGSW